MPSAPLPPSIPPLPPDRIWPLCGEFADAALEQGFRASTLARVVPQQRISLYVWACLLLVFVLPDYLALGPHTDFWWLAGYRVGVVALLLAYAEVLRRRPTLALGSHALMWLGLLTCPIFFLLYFLRPEVRALTTGGLMVIQLAMFLFVPVRVRLVVPVALLGAVGGACSYWAVSALPLGAKVSTVLLIAMPGVIGYVAALRLQKTERHEFWLRRQLQEEVAQRVVLQSELERQALADPLTGLPNRRALAERFALEAERAQRSGQALSLVMLDLDHFKQVNDRHGHAGGDAVLQGVAQLGRCRFRSMDLLARLGGEEFAALLPGATAAQAVASAERFGQALAALAIDAGQGTAPVHATATAGVAQWHTGESLDALMARADRALYAGKQAGRNRVVLASGPG